MNDLDAVPVVERAPVRGWARRALDGAGGRGARAWREAARPLGWAWGTVAEYRLHRPRLGPADRLPAPAIGIGNVTVGGGGKTSLVQWLLADGLPAGAVAVVVTRGYGRAARGTGVLRPLAPGAPAGAALKWGDEAALLARAGVWVGVGADRSAAARALAAVTGFDCLLLDDALQHRRVSRSLDLITFTADDLQAPARCLPAGPLRQGPAWRPPNGAWIVSGVDPRREPWPRGTIGAAFAAWWRELPGTAAAWADGGTASLAAWRTGGSEPFAAGDRPIVALTGVARPASVARFAAQAGHPVTAVVAWPDHYQFTCSDVAALRAAHPGAALVMTEKDAIKCEPAWFGDRPVGVLRRRLVPHDPQLLQGLVRDAIAWNE
ncbi:MAG: tetraacyldisaccharide 4'-kinase [Gemmatimonadota bacterium]